MSLVERALKKLQESAQPATERTQAPPVRAAGQVQRAAPVQPTQTHAVEPPGHIVNIDRGVLREMKLLPPPRLERNIANQYQQIKRALVAAAGQDNGAIPDGHLVMLTSALPGEGKTYTSINLALSLALEKDLDVLLVDADVAKPHISRLLGVDQEPGLLDLLTNTELHADSVILRTNVPGLSLLSAGRRLETATELLASQRMQDVVRELLGHDGKRIVLFDSPPLLLSTESRALVPSVGQVLLIVRAESTPQSAVMQAIDAAGESRPISLVLNQSSMAPSDGYYGYGAYGDAAQEAAV